MDKFNDINTDTSYDKAKGSAAEAYRNTKDKAEVFTEQVKEKASELYDEGKQKISDLENYFEDYSGEVVKKVKANPVTSLLVAGGIGYILSKLLSK